MLQSCTNENPFFRLLFLLFMLSDLLSEICCVPYEATLRPISGFTLDSCEIIMPGKNDPHPPYLDVYYVFPATLGYNPIILVAIRDMKWEGNSYFEYQNLTQSPTYLLIRLTKYPTVNTTTQNIYILRFNLLLCQDTHYRFDIVDFIYNTSATTVVGQSFTVLLNPSQFAILTGYQDMTDSNFVPGSSPTIVSNGDAIITFSNNNGSNGYMIKTLIYKLVTISHTFMYEMNTYYVVRILYYTCDLFWACGGTLMFFESIFPNKFFDGIMGFTAIASLSQNASFSFNLSASIAVMSNAHPFIFQFTLLFQLCPLSFKYFSARHAECYQFCPNTTYLPSPTTASIPLIYTKYYCDLCSTNCFTCYLTSPNCTACYGQNRYVLTNATQNTHNCLCPLGQYGTPPTCHYCNLTIFYCIICDSPSSCLECDAGLVYNPLLNVCECPPSLSQVLNSFTYIDSNNVTITVEKLRCISKKIVQNCMDSVLTNRLPLDMNIFSYGQTCSCVTGGEYIQNRCI